MKRVTFAILAVLLALTSCTPTPSLIEHPQPALTVVPLSYQGEVCNGYLGCPSMLPEWPYRDRATFETAHDVLGGLDPALPIVEYSLLTQEEDTTILNIYSGHCAFWFYYGYIVNQDGEMKVLDTAGKFKETFAPIDSANEALSYAVAMTGYAPMYNLESIENIDIQTPRLQETSVKKAGDGYVVHLFDWFICHCGPFYINTVDITVHKDGTLSIGEPQPGFRDPAMDGNCVD